MPHGWPEVPMAVAGGSSPDPSPAAAPEPKANPAGSVGGKGRGGLGSLMDTDHLSPPSLTFQQSRSAALRLRPAGNFACPAGHQETCRSLGTQLLPVSGGAGAGGHGHPTPVCSCRVTRGRFHPAAGVALGLRCAAPGVRAGGALPPGSH